MHLTTVRILLTVLITLSSAALAHAQGSYPTKPIRLIVSAAGGSTDFAARLVGEYLSPQVKQQVIVDNRPGANGVIGAEIVRKAAPDGYTLAVFSGQFWMLPLLEENVPYDPVKHYDPVTLIGSSPTVLVVHASIPVSSVNELIAYAKQRPGALNFATPSAGSPTHLAAELLKSITRIDIVDVRYKGMGPAALAVMSGEVQMAFASPVSVASALKSNRVKAIGVASTKPSPLAPGVPTIAEAGLPDFTVEVLTGLFAPAGTRPQIIGSLNRQVRDVLENPEVKQKFFASGAEASGSSAEEFRARIRGEIERWAPVIKARNIRS